MFSSPAISSFLRTCRYHLGTCAFGSFIIAVVQVIFLCLTQEYALAQKFACSRASLITSTQCTCQPHACMTTQGHVPFHGPFHLGCSLDDPMGFPLLHVPTEEARCERRLQAHYCDNGVYWRVSASTLLSTAVSVQGWHTAIQALHVFGNSPDQSEHKSTDVASLVSSVS